MTEEEKLDLAIDWIRSQGWNEENLPNDELLQMKKAYLAGLKAGSENYSKIYMLGRKDEREKKYKTTVLSLGKKLYFQNFHRRVNRK